MAMDDPKAATSADPAAYALLEFIRKSKLNLGEMTEWEAQFLSPYIVKSKQNKDASAPKHPDTKTPLFG
jgi:hypothetical protein